MKSEVHEGGIRAPLLVHWLVEVESGGPYLVRIRFLPGTHVDRAELRLGEFWLEREVPSGTRGAGPRGPAASNQWVPIR